MFLRPHQDSGVLQSAVQLAGISFLRETLRKGEQWGCVRVRRLLLEACGIARGGGGAPAGSEESPSLLYSATRIYSSSHAPQNISPQDILMFHTRKESEGNK
ncbi:hypothetical protein E2C01_015434 [Portunus trituberculatus]|uniref:Uncharacterized protein n=1 Tax=Portunus trituberculatus TaxID=210409 RepID=A0A5B7DLH9_PORTR|nr:hypothetical protein [Portunus trituberculatus]